MKKKLLPLFFLITIATKSISQNPVNIDKTKSIRIKYHPFIERLELCSGVNFNSPEQLLQSAFNYVYKPTEKNAKISARAYLYKYSLETEKSIKYDYKVEASLFDFAGGEGKFEANLKSNKNSSSMKFVFEAEAIYEPEIPDKNIIRMTNEATTLLNDEAKFTETYGQYFCSAIYKGHKIRIEINLRNSVATTFLSLFAEGKVQVALSDLGLEAQSSLRTEIRRVAKEDVSSFDIQTQGGLEIADLKSAIIGIFKKNTPDYEEVSTYVENILSKFKYPNAVKLECTLSDYSAWGIKKNVLIRDDILSTQLQLKKIHYLVSNEIKSLRMIVSDPILKEAYTAEEKENASISLEKLEALRKEIYLAFNQLNEANEKYIGNDISIYKKFYEIKYNSPEAFEFICSKQYGPPISFLPTISLNSRIAFLTAILNESYLLNTFNELSLFSKIDKIEIINEITQRKVEEIKNLNIIGSVAPDLALLKISDLIEPTRFYTFCTNIDNDIAKSFNVFTTEYGSQVAKQSYSYNIVLTDKFSRKYQFPFLEINMSNFVAYGNPHVSISATQSLSSFPCSEVIDFNHGKLAGGFQIAPPNSIILNLQDLNINYSDSVIIQIRTDNNIINKEIERTKELDRAFSESTLRKMIAESSFYVAIYNKFTNIKRIKISWFSKNKKNEVDSEIKSVEVPLTRGICNRSIHLK